MSRRICTTWRMRGDDFEAVLLAGIDGRMFPQYVKVGSVITALPETQNEYILGGFKFDDFYHVVHDPRRNKMLARFLEDHRPDVIHIHHSLWVGLEFIELCRKVLPDVKIIYTLHEYLAMCYSQGQLFRYHERAICHQAAPDQCVKCFPGRSVEEFIAAQALFPARVREGRSFHLAVRLPRGAVSSSGASRAPRCPSFRTAIAPAARRAGRPRTARISTSSAISASSWTRRA
jgi:hypothetical protein